VASVIERLLIKVEVDTKNADAGMSKFSKGLGKATMPAAAVAGALGAMALKAGNSASRLQQSGGAIDSVFASNADQVKAWAKAADQSVGLSEAAYGELASTIGAQLKNMGTPLDQVAAKTDELIRTGADLSATYGGTTADAVGALGSALRGETDPIEKYGIAIKQATIEAKVGKGNLKGMTDEQAKQAKTTALLSLVTEQAGGAMGAFGREADTAAGQQQRASAATEDAAASIGESLLPLMSKAAQGLAAFAGWVERNKTLVTVLAAVLGVLAVGVLAVAGALKLYNMAAKVMEIVSKAAWLSALGPVALVIVAIVAVVAIVVVMYKKFDWFRAFVDRVWALVKAGAKFVFTFIKAYASLVFKAITLYVRAWMLVAKTVFNVVKAVVTNVFRAVAAVVRWFAGIFRAIFNSVRTTAAAVWRSISGAAKSAFQVAGNAITWLRDKIAGVLDWIKTKWDSIFESLGRIAKSVMEAAKKPIDAIARAFDGVVSAVKAVIDWIGKLKFPSPPKWLSKIPGVGSLAVSAPGAPGATLRGGAAFTGAGGPRVATGAGGVVVNVSGALDPAAVAVQIRRILRDDDRRRGRVIPSGGTMVTR